MRYDMLNDPRYQQLTPTEKLTLHHIDWFSSGSGSCWRSIDTLAEGIGIKRRAMIYALRKLRDLGLIKQWQADGKTHRQVQSDAPGCNQMHEGVQPAALGGAISCTPEVQYTAPKVKEKVKPKVKEKYTPTFNTFWTAYPRKVGKRAALKAFTSALQRAEPDEILAGIENINTSDPKFIPHATTWLNRDGWEDEAAPQSWHNRIEEMFSEPSELRREDETLDTSDQSSLVPLFPTASRTAEQGQRHDAEGHSGGGEQTYSQPANAILRRAVGKSGAVRQGKP